MGIADNWVAYQFDLAVALVAEQQTKKADAPSGKRQYENPARLARERVAIPESGVW